MSTSPDNSAPDASLGLGIGITSDAIERTQINKFHTKGGTGFAAEDANAAADRSAGKTVHEAGRSNELNGADRITDGVPIQTKYFPSSGQTVESAFEGDKFRYPGQQLEVPADQYEECLRLMREKIAAGKVEGFTDPDEAATIVRKGSITYQQARNIARPGNLDSIVFDAKQQCVSSSYAFGISFLVNYARLRWEGQPTKAAVKDSLFLGLGAGVTSFISGVFSRQVLRTRAAALGVPLARSGVTVAYQSGAAGKVVIEKIAEASLGKVVHGAAAVNHVAKLLRSNVITGVVTTIVVSTPDVYRAAFKGSVSWAQLSKNVAVTGGGVAGGAAGWAGGAAVGAAIGSAVPVVGTAIGAVFGGIVGGLGGGVLGSAGTKAALDYVIEDDAQAMIRIVTEHMQTLAEQYLLGINEAGEFSKQVGALFTADLLRDMYASSDRSAFCQARLEPICQGIVAKRPSISAPDPETVQAALNEIEAEVLDADGATPIEVQRFFPTIMTEAQVNAMAHALSSTSKSDRTA